MILQALRAVKVSTPRDLSIMGRNPDILLKVIEHQLADGEQWDSLKNKVFCSILTDAPYSYHSDMLLCLLWLR